MLEIDQVCESAIRVIETEADAILALKQRIDQNFTNACEVLGNCQGRIVVIGMGKSGHVGKKIAATLASTGSPAFYCHAAEANHGDLGMLTQRDVVLAISNSGETPELLNILPLIKRMQIPLISLTGNPVSTLANMATINIDISVSKEACPLGLAPTSSSTATLVMGDAIAITLLESRGFTSEDFARFHPGGALGRRLLLTAADIMHTGDAIPIVKADCPLNAAIVEMTRKRFGMTLVTDAENKVIGIFTDGDLRRTLDKGHDINSTCIQDVMTKTYLSVQPKALAANALQLMNHHQVTALLVTDESHSPLGILHMHDILHHGIT